MPCKIGELEKELASNGFKHKDGTRACQSEVVRVLEPYYP